MSELEQCEPSAREDHLTFGIHCFKHLVKVEEVVFEHTTDISRLKQDARNLHDSDVVVVSNATVLTMESGNVQDDLIRDGVLVVRGGIIECVDARQRCQVPDDATVVDAKGGFVVPGYIDMHAHWSAYTVLYPARSWEMQTFLSYGVTTLHKFVFRLFPILSTILISYLLVQVRTRSRLLSNAPGLRVVSPSVRGFSPLAMSFLEALGSECMKRSWIWTKRDQL